MYLNDIVEEGTKWFRLFTNTVPYKESTMRESMQPEKIGELYDYLGLAAEAKAKGKEAVKARNYDDAWYYFNQQKSAYVNHINSPVGSFTRTQASVLLSSVHENLADVLRLEGKHRKALEHIVYWYAWGKASGRLKKSMTAKLKAYVKRCDYEKCDLEMVTYFANQEASSAPDFIRIQSVISGWQ